ncbi:hypothetical protein [Streptomyces sp. NPDC101145]|uniref:hypothetical protein n=1 Tax=Streptomyces sp. NPDC101145 TaxID=3366112 RepID=UPI003821808A
MKRGNRLPVAIGSAFLVTAALATPAAFADGTASADSGRSAFRAQAVAAGLTAAEATALQKAVDAALAQDGGKQTAANEIRYADGRLLLPLPGEKYARELDKTGKKAAKAHTCTYKALCGYSGRGYTGAEREWFSCVFHKKPSNWKSGGSWYNNQTPGRVGNWYSPTKKWLGSTKPAPWGTKYGQWRGVGYVKPC